MNLFNRVFIILLAVAWLLVWLVVIYFAGFDPDGAIEHIYNLGDFLAVRERPLTRGGIVSLSSILVIVSLLFVVLELISEEPPGVVLSSGGGGTTFVSKQSIVERVRYEAARIDGVTSAHSQVKISGRNVDVTLRLRILPEVAVPQKVEEVRAAVKEGLGSSMGITIRRLDIPVELASPAPAREAPRTGGEVKAPSVEGIRVPPEATAPGSGAERAGREETPS